MIDNFAPLPSRQVNFPATMALLNSIAGEKRLGPRHTAVARQAAGSGIPIHSDMMNWMLTMHLPLLRKRKTVEAKESSVTITIDDTTINWEVGKPTIIDTSYKHMTRNVGDEDMYLLMVDFWHPDLTEREISALKKFFKLTS